jgi:hypothetical protein
VRRWLAVLALLLAACQSPTPSPTATGGPTTSTAPGAPSTSALPAPTTAAGRAATLLAAGDIASCTSQGDEATASLLEARSQADAVAVLGDAAYETGSRTEYANCYEPTWGRFKAKTHPALGNHDYLTARAAGYFGEFGAAAGDSLGWYSYDLGPWHVVVLNSNCEVVGCATGGTQEKWLRADLAAHPAQCTLAYWHHPRFTSGTTHGPSTAVAPLFAALHEMGADVVLAGHEHMYERFAALDAAGNPDPARGIRSFVVGTGGASHYPIGPPAPGSEVRNNDTFGVLVLTLRADRYDWQFVPEPGKSFVDSGSGMCH